MLATVYSSTAVHLSSSSAIHEWALWISAHTRTSKLRRDGDSMLTWSYVFVLPVCTCLDYMKTPLLILLPVWRPTWASYLKSESGEDETPTRPYLLLSLRFIGMSFHYIKTTAYFACVPVCWLHEEPLNFSDYMKTSVIFDYLSPAPSWLEHNCPHEDKCRINNEIYYHSVLCAHLLCPLILMLY